MTIQFFFQKKKKRIQKPSVISHRFDFMKVLSDQACYIKIK